MQQNSSVNINSKHFIDRIENDIVQLAKTLSIEHATDIENAKLMARQITQRRINQLLTKEEQSGVKAILDNIKRSIKNGMTTVEDPKAIYELLKTFELL
jgi:CRISPR/Cas system-associated exonuclease Cas4 (RecB family)